MPEIHPVFPVFDIARAKAEEIIAAAEQVYGGSLDEVGADITILHPVFRELLIGVREGTPGRRTYPVMVLATDPALYDRARKSLTAD